MSSPTAFDAEETAILIAMYEAENGRYSSYTLMQKLHPDAKMGTEAAGVAFDKTRHATEQLIVKSLVSGERQTGQNGVYFEKLRLTGKGEQTAIQVRNSTIEAETQLQKLAELGNPMAQQILKEREKK
jgi:hypothetical protein